MKGQNAISKNFIARKLLFKTQKWGGAFYDFFLRRFAARRLTLLKKKLYQDLQVE